MRNTITTNGEARGEGWCTASVVACLIYIYTLDILVTLLQGWTYCVCALLTSCGRLISQSEKAVISYPFLSYDFCI